MSIRILVLFFCIVFSLGAETDLSLKFTEGETKNYSAVVDVKMTQSLPETCDMQYRFYAGFELTHLVKKVLENKNAEIEVSLKNPELKVSMICPMEGSPYNFTYDSSAQAVVNGDALPFQELKEALKEASYQITVSPNGQILSVDGLKGLQERIEKKTFAASPVIAQGIMALVSKEAAQIIHEPLFGHMPEKGVSVGETWVKMNRAPLQRSFTLVSEGETGINIKEEITLKLEQPKTEDLVMTIDLTGSINGTLQIDPKSGWPIENKASGSFSGKQGLKAPALTDPLEIPIKIDVATDYQLIPAHN